MPKGELLMRGSYKVIIQNNRVQFKLTINRNLTIIQGNSATGKTTLIDMVAAHEELGPQSGVTVSCKVPCKTVNGKNWLRDLHEISDSIVFIDEGNAFVRSREFAPAAKRSSNYYVIIARESLHRLPYSVDEIYGLKNTSRTTTKYPVYSRVYTSTYRIYGDTEFKGEKPELVIVDDSKSGFEFFSLLCKKSNVRCISAGGKSNICNCITDASENDILVIADGAAFGPEIAEATALQRRKNIKLFLPESFEWLVLKSGLFNSKHIKEMLLNPAEHIESSKFFSWEKFFTAELIECSRDTRLHYDKSRLNEEYLNPSALAALKDTLPDLGITSH